jgi:hypothetical protein
LSITARAASTGLRMRLTAATAPARSVAPSMIDASSSCRPAALYTAPRHIEKRIVFERDHRRGDRVQARAAVFQN